MPSFFTDAQKASLNAVVADIHDTWKLPVRAFKQGRQVVLSTSPTYSHVYTKPVAADTTLVTIERTIQARIYYIPYQQNIEVEARTDADSLNLLRPQAK